MRKMFAVFTLALAAGALALPALAAQKAPKEMTPVDAIRAKLLRLPYYGVFDFLAFNYEDGTVTLKGYAYQPALKIAAEHAVKEVSQVSDVVDEIEVLPVSINDDDLRWKIYYSLYTDPFLSRYAPAGGLLWGHRHRVPFGFFRSRIFPGLEPLGDYPIAIIVKDGHVTLMGVVDREADKNFAGLKAKGVFGSFGVENELEVDPGH
ncbi:MAG TPA: BON domain-containing protein [Thermoanaerobaculia bacterium]|jgi:hypothetical protein|nr:BON domain-containing protein [Thermoanaerobaculia bacterium]